MVSLTEVQASNRRVAQTLPAGLVAVFAGATAGIGETTLKEFARAALQPRIYFIGRSQEAGTRLTAELCSLNPGGQYVFVKADTSLLKNVDEVCSDIRSKENAVNVIFLSQGTLKPGETSEGLPYAQGLTYYSRIRFIVNLLPLLQKATSLRRVVTVLAGGKEGRLFDDDFVGRKLPMSAIRGHACTMMTLALEAISEKAPAVSFIHNYPGAIDTNLIRGDEGFMLQVMKYAFKVMLLFKSMPLKECGERHTFLCTSSKYPPREDDASASGLPLAGSVRVARGIDGKVGSGVYSVDDEGEISDSAVEELLAGYRQKGMVEKLWKHTEEEFLRITGSTLV
ncbi:NAD(P)-binding protein [Pleurostoma richardsiae]|uniref:NAD(P)-binding protein n=1 Tax=Pleurostoma richardsiae TaxID=41990 RepID=A0AA38VQM8_9PEZI|nr:NAD(P)-binding protein [Pleurostoma richardsiae]